MTFALTNDRPFLGNIACWTLGPMPAEEIRKPSVYPQSNISNYVYLHCVSMVQRPVLWPYKVWQFWSSPRKLSAWGDCDGWGVVALIVQPFPFSGWGSFPHRRNWGSILSMVQIPTKNSRLYIIYRTCSLINLQHKAHFVYKSPKYIHFSPLCS